MPQRRAHGPFAVNGPGNHVTRIAESQRPAAASARVEADHFFGGPTIGPPGDDQVAAAIAGGTQDARKLSLQMKVARIRGVDVDGKVAAIDLRQAVFKLVVNCPEK